MFHSIASIFNTIQHMSRIDKKMSSLRIVSYVLQKQNESQEAVPFFKTSFNDLILVFWKVAEQYCPDGLVFDESSTAFAKCSFPFR